MGTHLDAIERTIVFGIAVVSTGLNGASNALVGLTVHVYASFISDYSLIVHHF